MIVIKFIIALLNILAAKHCETKYDSHIPMMFLVAKYSPSDSVHRQFEVLKNGKH